MFSRLTGIPIMVGAAVAVPYLVTNGPEHVSSFWSSVGDQPAAEHAAAVLPPRADARQLNPPPRGPGSELYPLETPLEGTPSMTLDEVFRFDVSKEWVYQRWARKSTALAELGLFGVRVPLVTGTQMHDLAGSLTYFFDRAGRARKITFRGTTGDTTQLVMLVAGRFGLQRQTTAIAGEQLFERSNGGQVFSRLRTRPSAVLWSSSPHDSFSVDLQLQAPDVTTPLPSEAAAVPQAKSPDTRAADVADAQSQPEPTAEEQAAARAAEQRRKRKELEEKFRAYFPRSRVPEKQVESLEKRDLYW